MKKALKICGWIALAIVLLFALILTLSPVAKYVVNNYGEQIVGRQLHADRVVINPYWGGVTIRGFQCKEANGETNFVSFDHLYVQIAWPQLIGKRVILRHIHLDGFDGQVLKCDDKLNFSDIIERFSKDSTEAPKDTTKGHWTISLKDIRLNQSTLRYRDVVSDKQWSLEDVSLNVPGLYFDNTQTNAGLEFGLPTGGRVGLVAGYKMQSNRYAVRVNLYDVHTDVVLPLVQDYLDITGLGALMNGQIHVDGSLENITNIQLNGHLSMRGLSLRDKHKEEVAAMEELRVVIEKGDVSTNTYLLDTLAITGISGDYEVHKDWNTLSRLLKPHDAQPDSTSTVSATDSTNNAEKKSSRPLVWMAKVVTITGHDLQYHDYSMKNNWEYAIKTLRVDGTNVASNGRNSIRLKATLTGNAQLNLDFVGGLDVKKYDTRANLSLSGVNLKDFSALCQNYTGYPLERGVLKLRSNCVIEGGKLNGDNKIVIEDPKVGKKERFSKAPYKNIPVKAGVGLLTSAQNMIVLDVPVTGDASNPKFKLGKVIGRAILKVFFGPLMGVTDKKNAISAEELEEMQELLGEDSLQVDTLGDLSADVAMTAGDNVGLSEVSE